MAGAVLAVLLLAVGACSDDGGTDAGPTPQTVQSDADRVEVSGADLGPFAFATEGLAGPGTPLGGGLEVPAGALLVGVPFPDLVGGGYRALLVVTGDPQQVFSAFGEQAGRRGMDRQTACLAVEGLIGCTGTYVDRADGESLAVSLTRKVSPEGVVSGLGLRYLPPGSRDTGTDAPGEPPAPTAPLVPVELPLGPLVGPEAGDLTRDVREPGLPVTALESGSTLVGLPGPCACEGTGWSFVVELEGVPRDIVAAYARQFSDLGLPPDIADRQRDTAELLGVRVGSGTPVAEVRAVVTDGGRSYAIVTYVAE